MLLGIKHASRNLALIAADLCLDLRSSQLASLTIGETEHINTERLLGDIKDVLRVIMTPSFAEVNPVQTHGVCRSYWVHHAPMREPIIVPRSAGWSQSSLSLYCVQSGPSIVGLRLDYREAS